MKDAESNEVGNAAYAEYQERAMMNWYHIPRPGLQHNNLKGSCLVTYSPHPLTTQPARSECPPSPSHLSAGQTP
jgi:hypothetical protein